MEYAGPEPTRAGLSGGAALPTKFKRSKVGPAPRTTDRIGYVVTPQALTWDAFGALPAAHLIISISHFPKSTTYQVQL